MEFLKLACSDLTYKQIADEMNLSERTIDGYRESLFGKLNVQSRVGLCLEAIRLELVSLNK
jgi:DNA-binding CsgD family transcriptional regulator